MISKQRAQSLSSADALLARLIKLTTRKEDFITECFAAVLQADGRAASEYWRIVSHTLSPATQKASLREIHTQCRLGEGSCRCDMVIVGGRERIAVEHKLTAPQGKGQLGKYLSLPRKEVTRVMLVSADYQTVSSEVLRERRYVKPPTGQSHFLWADFYPLLQKSEARGVAVASATRGLFDRLGLQPAHPLIGELRTRDTERRVRLDAQLHSAWQPLLTSLEKRWSYVDSSIREDRRSEIYVEEGKGELLRVVWLDPFSSPGSLRIRLKTSSRAKRALLLDRLERDRSKILHGRSIAVSVPGGLVYDQRYPYIVELRIPWRALLGTSTRSSMPVRLKKFVLSLIAVADPLA
jgi:hypothetical protein